MRKNHIVTTLSVAFIYALPFLCLNSFAAVLPGNDILTNKLIEDCASKSDNESYDCSSALIQKSDQSLNQAYQKKLNGMKIADYSKWWMGDKTQKDNMISNFIKSQKVWLEYKLAYCKSASASEENTHGYGEVLSSCFINMNQRRVEDINSLPNAN